MEKNIRCFITILCLSVIFVILYLSNTPSLRVIMKEVENNFKSEAAKPDCTNITQVLGGKINITQQAPSLSEMHTIAQSVTPGGEYIPDHCHNPQHVAIIVPFRNRDEQLPVFLVHIHPFLMRQNIHYKIYIVNQADTNEFNRAMLMNVGFKEALKDYDWTCFIFHDVDHLPEDARNLYTCPDQPRHMAVAVDKWNYKLLYPGYFGGIVNLRREHFEKINGVCNEFWGWGGEDDDMFRRIVKHGMKITRYANDIARYTTIKHKKAKKNPDRFKIRKEFSGRSDSDGLSNVDYSLLSSESATLYKNITVELHRKIETKVNWKKI